MLSKLLRWLAGIYLFYLAICLFILLPALNIIPQSLVRDQLNRELRSEIILFNPFTLSLEARGLLLREESGHVPLAFKRLQANLSLESIWQPGIVLDAFLVDRLDIHVLRNAGGEFHFADLLTPEDSPEPEASDSALPALTIDRLRIEAHTLRFTDETRPGPYTTVQSDFRVVTDNLTTVPDREGDGELVLTTDGGGTLRWDGDLQIAEGRSDGILTFDHIDLRPLWRYEAGSLPFVVHGARFDATLNYAIDWSGDLQLLLSNSSFRLHQSDIQPADTEALPHTSIALADLQLSDINVNLLEQSARVAGLAVSGLNISGFDEDGVPSLLPMFMGTEAAPEDDDAAGNSVRAQAPREAGDETASGATGRSDDSAALDWALALDEFSLNDSRIDWRTAYLAPELVSITPRLTATALRWPAEEATPVELALTANEQATLGLGGDLHIGTGDGRLKLTLQRLPLPWINPLVTAQLRTDIRRGSLSLDTDITLSDFAPAELLAQATLSDFGTVLHETQEEAFTLAKLEVVDAAVDIAGQDLGIARVSLQGPTGSLHIREDGSINVNGVLRKQADPPPAADTGVDEADAGSEENAEPWRVRLDSLELREGQLDFADSSLPIPFKTLIADIEADLNDLDTASEKPLKVELRGAVDGYAPVLIQGSGRPLADTREVELRFDFRGIDIATMSPYSGTYAGYTIDSGTLNLDLRYALSGDQLQGDNHIVISQMQLGEPVESELAVDVPLKLGLALLTNSKGVIDLSVPISGDVDSPEFSLGKVIGGAIRNVFVKAVTAPFRLLAGLVGSDKDLEHIPYAVGRAEVTPEGDAALTALADALIQRPQLSLRIIGTTDPDADARALRERRLRAEFLAAGFSETAISNGEDAFLEALAARYAAVAVPEGTEEATGSDGSEPPGPTRMWETLLERTPLSANALQDLGTERAAAAKRELVNRGGVDAARIAISYDASLRGSGVEMELGS